MPLAVFAIFTTANIPAGLGEPLFRLLCIGVIPAAVLGLVLTAALMRAVHRRQEARLAASLTAKEQMLRELHHRVKNNLQVVSSLVQLEAGQSDGAPRRRLEVLGGRITILGRLHEHLYEAPDFGRIDISAKLRWLCAELAEPGPVAIAIAAEPLHCRLDTAIPLGLIVYELLANALGHGFPADRAGRIDVSLRRAGEVVVLTVRDDGIGLCAAAPAEGLGLRIAAALARQLGGDLEITAANPGTRARLTVPAALFG